MATNGIKEVKISNTNYLIEPTLLGTCGTAADTAIKDVTLSNFELFSGVQIAVKFSTTNTAAVGDLKLRVNSSNANDAKPIKYRGGNLPAAGTLANKRVYNFIYDGTNWELVGDLDTNTNNAVTQSGNAEDKTYPILFKNTDNTTDETAGVKYSNNISATESATKPFTYNPNTGILKVPKIQISIKDDSFGFLPYANNWNSLGASNLYWYRVYGTNYYGTRSSITNWDAGKNIGTAATSSAAATKGSVYFYNTTAANGTQTKTLLDNNANTNSNITVTLPSSTGTLALTSDITTAIQGLDVNEITNTAGKTVNKISETDGKIAISFQDISITKSQVSDFAHTHSHLVALATINSGDSENNTHAAALKKYFDDNKSTVPRNSLVNFYSSAHNNGSQAFGYWLSSYDNNPYGGFFVAHYNTPKYVGILNGTYTQVDLITSGTIGSQSVNYANSAGTATWATLIKPINAATTASASTWNIPSGSYQIWGERFSDTRLKYTPSGGSESTVTDTGDWTIWLTSGGTTNTATLNMRIDGTYYGSFSGNLSGNATTATTATNLSAKPSLAVSDNNITVTAGGKTSDAFTVPYATAANSSTTATTAYYVGKGTHAAAITVNEFTPAVGTLTLLGNVSNTTMEHSNNANAEMIIKTHPTSGSNYYEARLGFSSDGTLYYMPVNTNTWKAIAYKNDQPYIGKDHYIAYPSDGTYDGNGTITGYIKIKIPETKSATMFSFDVDIYNYVSDTATRYHIAGYNFSDASWSNCTAYCIAPLSNAKANLSVRFLSNGNDEMYVTIGETDTSWSYPKVVIHNIALGHSNATLAKWKSGWTTTITNTAFDNAQVKRTITNTNIAYTTQINTAAPTASGKIGYFAITPTTSGSNTLLAQESLYIYDTIANNAITNTYLCIGKQSSIKGGITLQAGNSYYGDLVTASLTANRTYTLPDATGTIALTSSNITGTAANVTGVVAIANGGTGVTTANDAANALISGLPTWTAAPTADTYFIRRDTGGTAAFGQVKFSSIANITNGKITLGPYSITPVTSVNGHTGSSVSVTAGDLGLSSALRYQGTTTTAMEDGRTTAAVTIGGNSFTPTAGDVVIYNDAEYLWTGSLWELIGAESSFKKVQTAVSTSTASGSSATTFVSSVTQDTQGVITVKTSTLNTSGTWSGTATTATTANILACPSITTETAIESGTRTYQGSGSTWTGSIASMTYASILQICGGYSRGWQIWATRGATESLHWRNPNSNATAWNDEKIILDSYNYKSYALPTNSAGLVTTEQMAFSAWKPTYLVSGTATRVPAKTMALYADGLAITNPTTNNDAGWIRLCGTSEANTVLEIATSDDANAANSETIAIRQYNTASIQHEAILLGKIGDIHGATKFPVATITPALGAVNSWIAYPSGGTYSTTTTTITGALKITLPAISKNTMMSFDVNIYTYEGDNATSTVYHISGYEYSSNGWHNPVCRVYSEGTGEYTNLKVRFGADSSKPYVTIGEANTQWSYPQVTISNVLLGYSNNDFNTWGTNWQITFVTTLPSASTGSRENVNTQSINITGSAASISASGGSTAKFWRGDNTWSDTISGGTLKITNQSNTVTIGSQNTSFCHIYNSANIPFIFNKAVLSTGANLGSSDWPFNNLYIGKNGSKGIYYVGTNSTNQMITFVDNTSDANGNGIKIGGGGVVVIGSGESSALSVTGGDENLYLIADSIAYLETNAQTLANRIGISINASGHVIPVKAEAANDNAQNLGSSSAKWANVYATTFTGDLSGNAATASQLKTNSGNTPHDYCLQYYSGQPTVGSADGNAYAGSSNNYKLWSYPDGATSASGGIANVQVLRFWWSTNYLHDIFVSPNYEEIYYRSIIGGTAKDWRLFLDDKNYTDNIKQLKLTTRIYPLVTSQEHSQWYKITFPYYNAETAGSAKWFMNSFDLHIGGGYNANPNGVIHIAFYWTRAASNGAWTLSQGAAKADGVLMSKVKLYYRVAEPGILYVDTGANAYNGIWIDNLLVEDTGPSLNWFDTTITKISAITNSTNPALSAYTQLPTVYTELDSSNKLSTNKDIKVVNSGYGLYLTDSAAKLYAGIYDNGSNLWIGATSSTGQHHKGSLYLSSGHNGTSGNTSIYISIPTNGNATTTHTSYPIAYAVSSADNAVSRFDSTTGAIQSSTTTINDTGTMTIKGKLIVNPSYDTSNSYNEGVRINLGSNGWANVHFGGAADSASGTTDGGWLVGRRGAAGAKCGAIGDFTIEEGNSDGGGLTIHKDYKGMELYTSRAGSESCFKITNVGTVAASGWVYGIEVLSANMAANSNITMAVGHSSATKNRGYLGFHYAGSGSNDNYVELGLYGVNGAFKLYGNRLVELTDNLKFTSTTAIKHIEFSRTTANGGPSYICYPQAGQLAIGFATGYDYSIGVFDADGGLRPGKTNTYYLGTSSYKWSSVYATTFYGALSGNATSASKISAKLAATTKTYLLGTATTITATAANVEITGDTSVYLTTTAGELSAVRHSWNVSGTEKAYTVYNTTDDSIDFVFI